jgi:hypothetical protein
VRLRRLKYADVKSALDFIMALAGFGGWGGLLCAYRANSINGVLETVRVYVIRRSNEASLLIIPKIMPDYIQRIFTTPSNKRSLHRLCIQFECFNCFTLTQWLTNIRELKRLNCHCNINFQSSIFTQEFLPFIIPAHNRVRPFNDQTFLPINTFSGGN